MPIVIHNHFTRDINIEAIRALYERPGTPGEKAAAAAALQRYGASLEAPPKPTQSTWYVALFPKGKATKGRKYTNIKASTKSEAIQAAAVKWKTAFPGQEFYVAAAWKE